MIKEENNNKVIAFYLPQYHPTPSNDMWWGKDFTEWTNVRKAKALYKNHYQPKEPDAEIGYYDLRDKKARQKQVELAKEAGVHGFCYYHYWFGDDRRELELPFNVVLNSNEPDFPFCLCWANESWYSKLWNKDGTSKNKLLVEQKYLDENEYIKHFYSLLPAFKDKRYIKYGNKPVFMVYKALEFEDVTNFLNVWKKLAQENGFDGIHFIGYTTQEADIQKILNKGFDAVNIVRLYEIHKNQSFLFKAKRKIRNYFQKEPYVYSYEKFINSFTNKTEEIDNIYPSIIPNWDHTPRSNVGGFVLHNSTPELFRKHVRKILDMVKNKKKEDKIIFLKSWNEWGEGNYMEPDKKYGKGYINVLSEELKK